MLTLPRFYLLESLIIVFYFEFLNNPPLPGVGEVIKTEVKIEVKEESLEDQIEYLLHYARLHNDPTAALKVLELEVLLMERDSATCPVKLETRTDLETVDNECLSCDSSVSEAQSLHHFNDGQEDPKLYQCAESPPDCIFSSSDLVPLTAAHSEYVPSQSYQGGSSSAEPVVEIPSDNFDQEQSDKSPSRSKDMSAGKYQCKHCSYQTDKLQHFKVHKMIHTGEKPYSCEQCAYKADYKSHLKVHERIHSGVKPFACKQCSYTTAFKSDLSRHIRTHSGVKPFACNQCSYTTALKSALKRHKRTHSGVKPFACNQCSYTTALKSDLQAHELRHSGVKPLACNQCSYTTAFKSTLNRHKRTHSGVKPFACKQCRYTTVRKENLKRHERTHL